MKGYQTKDEAALVYDSNKRYIRAVGQSILQRLLNDALTDMTKQFDKALVKGDIKEIASLDAVEELMATAMQKQLTERTS